MIIQFDVHQAKHGSSPTDHVWKIDLSGTELAALYGLMKAAGLVLSPRSPANALAENMLLGLQCTLNQCRAGKVHPVATILTAVAPEPPGLAQEIDGAPLPVVLTGQGEYAKAWPPGDEAAIQPVSTGFEKLARAAENQRRLAAADDRWIGRDLSQIEPVAMATAGTRCAADYRRFQATIVATLLIERWPSDLIDLIHRETCRRTTIAWHDNWQKGDTRWRHQLAQFLNKYLTHPGDKDV